MAIDYDWTCSACGAANAAGTDSCGHCDSRAITSAHEISTGTNTIRRAPLSTAQRAAMLCAVIPIVGGIGLMRVSPTIALFCVGAGLVLVGFGAVFVAEFALSSARRRK